MRKTINIAVAEKNGKKISFDSRVKRFMKENNVPWHIADRAVWHIQKENLLATSGEAIKVSEAFWKKADQVEEEIKRFKAKK